MVGKLRHVGTVSWGCSVQVKQKRPLNWAHAKPGLVGAAGVGAWTRDPHHHPSNLSLPITAPKSFLGGRGREDDWLTCTYEAKTREWVMRLTWGRTWGWGGGPQGCVCLALPKGPGAHITRWTFEFTLRQEALGQETVLGVQSRETQALRLLLPPPQPSSKGVTG